MRGEPISSRAHWVAEAGGPDPDGRPELSDAACYKEVMRLSAKFVKVLVVLSAFVVGVVVVTTPTLAPASATGVSCSVYVANETGNTVSVIDAAPNTVTAAIAVGVTPSGVAAFCPTPVTISGTGAYWNVGTLAEPRFTG